MSLKEVLGIVFIIILIIALSIFFSYVVFQLHIYAHKVWEGV